MQQTLSTVIDRPIRAPMRAATTPSGRRFTTTLGALAPALVTVLFLIGAIRGGLSIDGAVRATLAVLVLQVAPGALVWRAIRPRAGWWMEDLAVGFAIGSVLAIGTQVVAGLTRLPWLSTAAPMAVVAILLAVPGVRRRAIKASTSPLPVWWGPSVAAAMLVTIQTLRLYFRDVPLTWASGSRAPHVDSYLHLALSGQLANRGPTRFPWVESEPLAYHWFSHAWVAQVSRASGTELDEVLFRFMPVLMPLVVLVSVAIAAVRLSGRSWTGPLAAWLAIAGGDLNVWGFRSPGYPIAPLSPTLALAAPMLITIVVVLALRWRGELHRASIALLPLLVLGAAGTKGSTVPLVVAGLGLAVVAMLILDRSRVPMLLGDLAIVGACLAVAYAVVFRGSGAGLHIDVAGAAAATSIGQRLGTLATGASQAFVVLTTVAGLLSRGAGSFALLGRGDTRRDPLSWLLIGAGLAGAIAVGVFAHPGSSQYYFARSASPLMALGSALGLVVILDMLGARARRVVGIGLIGGAIVALGAYVVMGDFGAGGIRHAAAMTLVAGLIIVIVAVLGAVTTPTKRSAALGSAIVVTILAGGVVVVANTVARARQPAPLPSIEATAVNAVSRDQIEASRWIRDNSDVGDLVMTNRHCITSTLPDNCDNRRFVVAAFGERQVLVEGWTPAPKAQDIAPEGRDSITVNYWHPELLALNDRFIAAPSEGDATQLRDLGVRWIFVDHTVRYAETLEPYAELRFQNPGVDVYEFVDPDS
jgi:hypothetical protein